VRLIIAFVVAVFALAMQVHGEPIFDVGTLEKNANLGKIVGAIVADNAAISVEVPSGNGTNLTLDLDAYGKGPPFYWALYTLQNKAAEPRDVILVVAHRGFVSSGLFQPSHTGSLIIKAASSNPAVKFSVLNGPREDLIAIHLEPGQTMTAALQGMEKLPIADVWTARAYEQRQSQLSGLHGAILGIALLLALGIGLVAVLRNSWFACAALILSLAFVLFLAQELGLTQAAYARISDTPLDRDQLRAVVESLLCAGYIVALIGMSGTDRTVPVQRVLLWVLVGLAIANMALLFFNPALATGFARIGIGFLAIEGILVLLRSQRNGMAANHAMPFWLALCGWTALATVAIFSTVAVPLLTIVLLLGACALLAYLGFVVLEHVFIGETQDAEYDTEPQESELRSALALSSARHYLWEWSMATNEISLAGDFWNALGYAPNAETLEQQHFLEAVHPDDIAELLEKASAVATTKMRVLEHDFRYRDAEGRYRWFALRARAHNDEDGGNIISVGTLTDITKSKELEARLQKDAVHDPVTGLPSRALFLDRLQRSLSSRVGSPVRVLIIDLDRFRTLNEGYGADVGDELLLITAKRIQERLGAEDSATRLTGSQFAVAYAELSKGEGELAFATAIMSAVAAPIVLASDEVVLSVSAGLSHRGLPGAAPDELISQATSALLAAKSRGAGQLVTYDIGMRNDRVTQVALESSLRQAIARAEIEVHFQPIHALASGAIAGFEALARWRHPTLGLIAPEQFINAAEEAGLIGELGQIVLAEAARNLGIWQRTIARSRNLFMAVNVSATQLLEQDYAASVQHVLNREGLVLGSLKIEVTEAVVTRHRDRVLALFGQLRNMGVGLSCDDFGTGYSSLSTLRDLPFDTLKLDRSFVTPQYDDDRASHVIRSVLELAHGLAMSVVCEGIETQEQAERLETLGCDFGQGFYFGQAIPARNVEQLLLGQTLRAFETTTAPAPGAAPLAPRQPLILPLDAAINGPDVLPSIFKLNAGPVKKKKKTAKKVKKRKKAAR
jgi:diguanylate cyclase (GGDEF)-like protein/PAS domain S-box-containing protein